MHLTDADFLGDLGLRPVVEEPQLDDGAFAFGQVAQHGVEQHAVLGDVEVAILGAESSFDRGRLVVLAGTRVE